MNYTIYILHCSSSLSKDYAELVTTLWYWLLVELQNVPIIQKIEVSENKRYVFCIAVAVALFIPYQKMLQLHDFQLKHLVIILMIHMLKYWLTLAYVVYCWKIYRFWYHLYSKHFEIGAQVFQLCFQSIAVQGVKG